MSRFSITVEIMRRMSATTKNLERDVFYKECANKLICYDNVWAEGSSMSFQPLLVGQSFNKPLAMQVR